MEKLDAFTREAEEIVNERLTNGRQESTESTIRGLLEKIDYNSRTNPDAKERSSGMRFNPGTTLFCDAAMDEKIEEAE